MAISSVRLFARRRKGTQVYLAERPLACMASADLSRRVEKVVGSHHSQSWVNSSENLPGKGRLIRGH